jgi:CspA family cold shock protein
MQGQVILFNSGRGFGFIQRHDGEKDLFVHHSCINMEGYRTLKEGQRVTFEVEQGPNGLQAANVTVEG